MLNCLESTLPKPQSTDWILSAPRSWTMAPYLLLRLLHGQHLIHSRMRERFFVGRVWADAGTFQIVKVSGKVEPQGKQRFPTFETWRETSQEHHLFPTRTHADDVLRFPSLMFTTACR